MIQASNKYRKRSLGRDSRSWCANEADDEKGYSTLPKIMLYKLFIEIDNFSLSLEEKYENVVGLRKMYLNNEMGLIHEYYFRIFNRAITIAK